MRLVSHHSPIRRQARLNKGLLRWWRAEPLRTSAPRMRGLTSKSPMTLSGALQLGPRGLTGAAGASVFNGTADYGQTASIDLSSLTTMAVSFWLWWDAFANDNDFAIESSAASSSNPGAILISPNDASGNVLVRVRTGAPGNNQCTFTRPSAAAWHHWVVCWNRSAGAQQTVAVYVDGVSQALTPGTSNTDGTAGFGNHVWNFMSRNATSNFGAGRLSSIRIYDRVLAAWEPRALMHEEIRGCPTTLRWSRGVDFLGEAPAAGTTFNYYNRRRRNA